MPVFSKDPTPPKTIEEARQRLEQAKKIANQRGYPTPAEWDEILECEHFLIAAGALRPAFYSEN